MLRIMPWHWKSSRDRKQLAAALASLALALPSTAADGANESPPRDVTLDQLLTLPDALPVESGERAGVSRAEWSSRFAAARAELDAAQAGLDESLKRLSELAGESSNWKVAAPGGQANATDNSPIDYGLKQEIRRKREELARAERKYRDLTVEANLAGVPEHWYAVSQERE
ncbi:MAG TPA: hypothetical protein VEC18_04485 [Myxococcota bacterium]|nr:hypothetical protein [Myxococcota bacterium]